MKFFSLRLLTIALVLSGATLKASNMQMTKPIAKTPAMGTKTDVFVPKLGFVDPYAILGNLYETADVQNQMQDELKKKAADLEKLVAKYQKLEAELRNIKDASAVSDQTKRKKEQELTSLKTQITIQDQAFKEDTQRIQQDAQMALLKKIEAAITEVAKMMDIDVMLGMGVIYISPKADEMINLTAQVISYMNDQYNEQKKKSSDKTTGKKMAPVTTED